MEQLSKLSLNNQIVNMRHIVRKSKVHIINKLTRDAKKLRIKKGTEKQIAKHKKKAERFINELLAIKKLNNDVVSKFALQREVPSTVILNSVDVSVETRALAKLAGHKFIVDSVQCFRNKYPDWKLYITDLLNVLGTNSRGSKKPNGNKTKILKKKIKTMKDIKEIKDTHLDSEDDIGNISYKTDPNKSDVTLEETQTEVEQVEKMLSLENNPSDKDENKELKPVIIAKDNSKNLGRCDKIVKCSQTKIHVLETSLLPEKYSNFSTNKCIDEIDNKFEENPLKRKTEHNISSSVDFKKKRTIVEEIKPVYETVDSFFMTADDKDYMSVYKPLPIIEQNLSEYPKVDSQVPSKEIFIKGKKVAIGKQNNMGNRRERRQQVEEPQDTVLHPSWEAKRKQKSLAKFEGKKIIFDDQD